MKLWRGRDITDRSYLSLLEGVVIELEGITSDSKLDDGAPSLEDRCQVLRQKIGSLEADIFRAGRTSSYA